MKKGRIIAGLFFLFFFVKAFSQNVSYRTDDDFLYNLIEEAYKNNLSVDLEKNRIYKITKPLLIKCSVNGNNAQIIPYVKKTVAVSFVNDNIVVNNLNIVGGNYKMIDVVGDNILFNKCKFETHNYFVLLRLSGNNCTIKKSSLINTYKEKKQLVIKNKKGISINNFTIENSEIKGGFHFLNEKPMYFGNYNFKNNNIIVDYSHVNQDIINQNDAFHFAGIKDVFVYNNNIKLTNVTRGFKFTDYSNKKDKTTSKFPTTNVEVKGNTIFSNSKNGKQLFDLFNGTAKAIIEDNEIHSRGHTTIFEDKTTYILETPRELILKKNKIYFDFRLIYYRGAKYSDLLEKKVSLLVEENDFYFTQKKIKLEMKRIGSSKDFKLEFPIYARSIGEFYFYKNNLFTPYIDNAFKTINYLYLYDVKETAVYENAFCAKVLVAPSENSVLKFHNNITCKKKKDELIKVRPLKGKFINNHYIDFKE